METCISNLLLEYIFSLIFTRGFVCCARKGGQGKHNFLFSWWRISQSEIRKIAAAKKRGRGGNSFSPHPFFFPLRPSGKVFCSAARSAAIKIRSPDFRQNKFGFCPKGTAGL
jgi:hypothetical protein